MKYERLKSCQTLKFFVYIIRREYTFAQISLCKSDNLSPFLKQAYLPTISPGQNRAWSTLKGAQGKATKWEIPENIKPAEEYSVPLTPHPLSLVMELEQLRAAFELQREEIVSLLIKDYRGDVDVPNRARFSKD